MTTPNSGDWQHLAGAEQRPRYERITREIGDASDVLDVGCGSGELARYLQPFLRRYAGIDPSLEATSIAMARGLKVWCGQPEAFRASGWPCIVFSESLYYAKDPMALLDQFSDMLAPGGKLIVTIWLKPDAPGWKRRLQCLWDHRRPRGNQDCAAMVDWWVRHHPGEAQTFDVPKPGDPARPWRFWVWKKPHSINPVANQLWAKLDEQRILAEYRKSVLAADLEFERRLNLNPKLNRKDLT